MEVGLESGRGWKSLWHLVEKAYVGFKRLLVEIWTLNGSWPRIIRKRRNVDKASDIIGHIHIDVHRCC
jgi:hypothetical protein